MRANDPKLRDLRRIAAALGELREQVVFVGGAVTGLLVTAPLADSVRAIPDVGSRLSLAEAQTHENVLQDEISEKKFLV